ncbi:MAG: hypothetical protein KKA05_00115 [Alphaproteobacteria bacterium]|nr:hypothetical protein [Alphaproteobacteria bacterium]
MFNNNIGIMHNTALYADRPHGSRFASFWFLPGILHKIETNAPDGATACTTYSQMLATDFDKYKPQLLFIGRFALKKDSPEIFDFGAFFAADPTFAAQWRKYNKTGTITTTNADYYAGTALDNDNPIIFDIYERQK